jgi:hypothetical protein
MDQRHFSEGIVMSWREFQFSSLVDDEDKE